VYRKVQLATADRDSTKLSVEAEAIRRRQGVKVLDRRNGP
jgi:hypothetical protein